MFMKHFFVLFLALPSLLAVQAQRFEVGLLGGVSAYSGDLSPREFGVYYNDINPAGGAFLRLYAGEKLAFRLGVNFGQVEAADGISNNRTDRMLNFRSRISEVALLAEYDLFVIGSREGLGLAPFVFAGVGLYKFNPEARVDDQWVALQPLGTEGQGLPNPNYDQPYSLTQLNVPLGAGVKFFLGEVFTLGLELGGRKLFTDYLDDVGYTEVNYLDVLEGNGSLAARLSNPTLGDPSEAEKLTYRRGGKYKDWYYISGVTLSFRFGGDGFSLGGNSRKVGCPYW